jgi:hypothetical protein
LFTVPPKVSVNPHFSFSILYIAFPVKSAGPTYAGPVLLYIGSVGGEVKEQGEEELERVNRDPV